MLPPKIQSAQAINEHILVVEFNNHQKKQYDIRPLLSKEIFEPLKNLALFKSVQVEPGGYALVWNDSIDISENEIWQHGQSV